MPTFCPSTSSRWNEAEDDARGQRELWGKFDECFISFDMLWWILRSLFKCNSLGMCFDLGQYSKCFMPGKKACSNKEKYLMTFCTLPTPDCRIGRVTTWCNMSWTFHFRMWHRLLSTPPSWSTSSLASSRFCRMERCNSSKKNLHRWSFRQELGRSTDLVKCRNITVGIDCLLWL